MATRAVAKINVDWSKLADRVGKSEVAQLNKLKSAIDGNAIKAASLPDSLPQIDWAFYKEHASEPKIVEELEKKYKTMKIEAPQAPAARLATIDRAQELDEARYNKFCKKIKQYIEAAEVVKKKFEVMIPVPDMTLEDYHLTFPRWRHFDINNPSLAPHYGRAPGLTREEQIAWEQPDPLPYATKTAWKDWEERKKKYYS